MSSAAIKAGRQLLDVDCFILDDVQRASNFPMLDSLDSPIFP